MNPFLVGAVSALRRRQEQREQHRQDAPKELDRLDRGRRRETLWRLFADEARHVLRRIAATRPLRAARTDGKR